MLKIAFVIVIVAALVTLISDESNLYFEVSIVRSGQVSDTVGLYVTVI